MTSSKLGGETAEVYLRYEDEQGDDDDQRVDAAVGALVALQSPTLATTLVARHTVADFVDEGGLAAVRHGEPPRTEEKPRPCR
jgi:hypothetical protein